MLGPRLLPPSTLLFDLPYPGWECFYCQPPINVVTELGSSSKVNTSASLKSTENGSKNFETSTNSASHNFGNNGSTQRSDGVYHLKDVAVPYDHSLTQDDVDGNELPPIWSFEQFERSSSAHCWLRKDI